MSMHLFYLDQRDQIVRNFTLQERFTSDPFIFGRNVDANFDQSVIIKSIQRKLIHLLL
jgi:hypothetical protein